MGHALGEWGLNLYQTTKFRLFLTQLRTGLQTTISVWVKMTESSLNSSSLKEFADDNFIFDEYGRKFSKRVENTVVKGEIARYEQFVLFPRCFQKTCTADT